MEHTPHDHGKYLQRISHKRIDPPPLTGQTSVAQVIEEAFLSYNAGRLREACRLFATKMLADDAIVGLSLSGALTPAGLGISALAGLTLGVAIGLLPVAGAGFGTLVAVLSMIPPMAVLPILFIVFGLGELSKVVLIIIGVTPMLVRDISLEVAAMPREQLIKAQTLGASTWQVAIRVVLPQIMPRLIKGLRLMIGPAFLFLISAEAIAADVGLGYRIFLVRRYLSMDVILPYVAWITLLAYLFDLALVLISRCAFPWAYEPEAR